MTEVQENPELSNKRTARIAELDADIEAKEAELKKLKAEIIEAKEAELKKLKAEVIEIKDEEEKPQAKVSRGRGGKGLGKGNSYKRELSTYEKIIAEYEKRNYEFFKDEQHLVEYLKEAFKDKEGFRIKIEHAVADLLPMINENSWIVELWTLMKLVTLPINDNNHVRFDEVFDSCEDSIADEYAKFFESVLDNFPFMDNLPGEFTCKQFEVNGTTLKHYLLEYELNVDSEGEEI